MSTIPIFTNKFLKLAFGFGLFVILCIGGFSYMHNKELANSTVLLKDTYEVNLELKELLSNLRNAETSERGFLLAKDSLFFISYTYRKTQVDSSISKLKFLSKKNYSLDKNLKKLDLLVLERLNYLTKSVDRNILDSLDSYRYKATFAESKIKMDSIRSLVNHMISLQNGLLTARSEDNEKSINRNPILLFSTLIITLILLLIAYSIINRDLKSLKQKNNQLELFKETANLAEIISKYGSWEYDIESDRYKYSDNFYRIIGEEPQSFTANVENFINFVHEDDVEKLKQQIEKMYVEQDLPFIQYRIIRTDGALRYIRAFGELFENVGGKKKLIGTITDITDEVESSELIEERNTELLRNNKELEAFNYVASHDLQEPLRKIQTFISRLEDKEYKNISEGSQLYMDRIKKSADRMRKLIDDLLQFSRTNKDDKVKEVTQMNSLLEEAKQELMEAIVEHKAIITNEDMPKMKVVPFQIKQLFINLIGNSLKYSKDDISPIINITYEKVFSNTEEFLEKAKVGFYHKVIIKDNSIGFEPEYSAKIFTLFNRLHGKGEYSGTGIGLSICKKIIENHQGFIFADGELGVGATFCFYLPID